MSVDSFAHRRAELEQVRASSDVELASRVININSELERHYLHSTAADFNGDQAKAWLNYRRTGEVRYAVERSAHIAGYARYRAVKVNSANKIVEEKESGVEADIVASITSPYGGVRALTERYYKLMKVPGQGFFVRCRAGIDGTGDEVGYFVLSASEISREGDPATNAKMGDPVTWRMRRLHDQNSQSAFERKVLGPDFFGRIWVPDPEFVEDPTSPMASIADACDQLHKLRESISARLMSRFAHAGILLIPNQITDAAISGDKPTNNLYSNDKVMNYLIHVMVTNIVNHAQGIAAMPIVLKGPAEVLDKVRHLIAEAAIADTDIKLRAELIEGILTSLDQQKQSVKGGEGTSHWGMWAVSDEERRITVQPDIENFCAMLDNFVLWPQMAARNRKPGDIRQWRVWYDLSGAAVRANQTEQGWQLYDRGLANPAHLRQINGVPETAVMSPEEVVRAFGWKNANPILAFYGLEGIEVDMEAAAAWGKAPGPNADSPADETGVGPGKGDPGSPSDRDSDTPKSKEPG